MGELVTVPYDGWIADTVVVEGPDAVGYLNGQLSNDIAALRVGESCWSFVLEPSGKVSALVAVDRVADERIELRVDAGFAADLVARLLRFKIRVKADVSAVAGERPGPGAGTARTRIEAGWPAMGAELDDSVIPAETGLVSIAVSFTKGCYTGQELVARIDSRGGNVPRHLRHLSSSAAFAVGDLIVVGEREVGRVTSAVADPEGTVGLAYVHRSVAVPSTAMIGGVVGEITAAASAPSEPLRGDQPGH
jgi:folate-binding protein YgfZ